MAWKLGMAAGVCMFGISEIPGLGEAANVLQFGAIGVLFWATMRLFGELAEQRKAHKETVDSICERWDGWEKTRHNDHEQLNATMASMRENCAAAMRERDHHAGKP